MVMTESSCSSKAAAAQKAPSAALLSVSGSAIGKVTGSVWTRGLGSTAGYAQPLQKMQRR